ncbi:hypothetical protein ACFPJ1_40870 [Kribbella qitaiheensis]|uniref:hypothetical protein n=1 Tax=Kribbella qitaiheensis TaxID=1544730 RepID=UPI00360B0BD5
MIVIEAKHVGRTAKTLLAGTNSHGTTEIATGAKVEIQDVFLPFSHLDGPDRAQVVVRDIEHGRVCSMEARHLQLLTDTVGPSDRPVVASHPDVTWGELKDALRPLNAFADQDEIALGAAADAVLELLAGKASA